VLFVSKNIDLAILEEHDLTGIAQTQESKKVAGVVWGQDHDFRKKGWLYISSSLKRVISHI
jgi:hypothetical protein